jgi:hypothetical protein
MMFNHGMTANAIANCDMPEESDIDAADGYLATLNAIGNMEMPTEDDIETDSPFKPAQISPRQGKRIASWRVRDRWTPAPTQLPRLVGVGSDGAGLLGGSRCIFEDSTLAAARMAGGFGPVFPTCELLAFDKRQQACRGL